MTPIADLIRQLGNSGCSIEQIAVAVAHQENLMHGQEQKRRGTNSARQQRYRDRNVTRRNDTQRNVSLCNAPPVHIEITPPLREKPKKVSLSIDAADVPTSPTEEARGFASEKGWDRAKIDLEWQRFRDHGLTKGRKHRNLLAAWRNWVTSPFQTNSPKGPVHVAENRSLVAAARRAAERLSGASELGDRPGESVLRLVSEG